MEHKTFTLDEFGEAFDPAVRYVMKKNSFQRNLEYSGKNGGFLTFIYSEFSDDMAREAFTREFKIDLNEGNVGAYKGAVFEVLEATNAQIKYRIIRHFPES